MSSTNKKVEILAQAKINLALRVFSRDAIGYHPLETLFLRLELSDLVSIQVGTRGRSIVCSADLGQPEDNLAFRAASMYAAEAEWPDGWEIRLDKRIPAGAGLGGGSADAGAVLRCLNSIAPSPLSTERLLALAGRLGADVPFMTTDSAFAYATGYGDRLTPLGTPEQRTVALLVPPFAVSTPAAYAWFDEAERSDSVRTPWNLEDVAWSNLGPLAKNDLQDAVAAHHPEILQAIDLLRSAGARIAAMTGSGSVVFGIFPIGREPGAILVPAGWNLIWTRTANSVVEPRLLG